MTIALSVGLRDALAWRGGQFGGSPSVSRRSFRITVRSVNRTFARAATVATAAAAATGNSRVAEAVGRIVGLASAGAAIGGGIGTAFPGIGTAIGTAIGAGVGAFVGLLIEIFSSLRCGTEVPRGQPLRPTGSFRGDYEYWRDQLLAALARRGYPAARQLAGVWALFAMNEQGGVGWIQHNPGNMVPGSACVPYWTWVQRNDGRLRFYRAFSSDPEGADAMVAMAANHLIGVRTRNPAAYAEAVKAAFGQPADLRAYAAMAYSHWVNGGWREDDYPSRLRTLTALDARVSRRAEGRMVGSTDRLSRQVCLYPQSADSIGITGVHEAFHLGSVSAGALLELTGEEDAAERFARGWDQRFAGDYGAALQAAFNAGWAYARPGTAPPEPVAMREAARILALPPPTAATKESCT